MELSLQLAGGGSKAQGQTEANKREQFNYPHSQTEWIVLQNTFVIEKGGFLCQFLFCPFPDCHEANYFGETTKTKIDKYFPIVWSIKYKHNFNYFFKLRIPFFVGFHGGETFFLMWKKKFTVVLDSQGNPKMQEVFKKKKQWIHHSFTTL